ncbi:MAG: radical SAM protein [Candidatus Pacearchaeota archaeon]|jgi:radical SAM superfamily enzyme YgiQ (UPF0313 family)
MVQKVLLVKSPIKYPVKIQGDGGDVGIPLNLLYLGAYLREKSKVQVVIKDYRLEKARKNSFDLERDFQNFDVIATGACTSEYNEALRIMKIAKNMGKTTIMGGIFPTFNSSLVLSSGVVDYVVRGEGEITLNNLINSLDQHSNPKDLKGISFIENGEIIDNPRPNLIHNLDDLPMPAYDLISLKDYMPFTSGAIYSSRGCNNACNFCSLSRMWNFSLRQRSPENIIKELKIYEDAGFKRVHFKDESVTLDLEFTKGLFKKLENSGLKLNYKVKSRIDQVTPEVLEQMVLAGVDTIHTGVESFSQSELNRVKKGIDASIIRGNITSILDAGIKVNPVYIFGLPGQTESDLEITSKNIQEIGSNPNVITYISFMTPHPGTLSKDGLEIISKNLDRYTHKQPVCYPLSLGPGAVNKMVDKYHELSRVTNSRFVNPPIDTDYLRVALKSVENKYNVNSPELVAS